MRGAARLSYNGSEMATRFVDQLRALPARPGVYIMRDAPGDRDKARQLLAEAVAMYREIGMPKHGEMAEELLGQL